MQHVCKGNVDMNLPAEVIPCLKGVVSEEEWRLRVELAAAYRLAAFYGWDDLIFTHISVRIPGPEHYFLLNPYGLMFEEITASSLVKVDMEGKAVSSTSFPTNGAGFTIHSAMHMARPDALAVIHVHTPSGQAVSAQKGLMPLTQTAMAVLGDVAYHDFEGPAFNLDERVRLIADMGEKHMMILRNHGTLAIGSTIGEAFLRLYLLERACEAQVLALTAGSDEVNIPHEDVAVASSNMTYDMTRRIANELAWPALLRKAYRLDPRFAT